MENKFIKISIKDVESRIQGEIKEARYKIESFITAYENEHNRKKKVKDEILENANAALGIDSIMFTNIEEGKDEGTYKLSFDMYIGDELVTNFDNGHVVFIPEVLLKSDGEINFDITISKPKDIYEGSPGPDTLGFIPNHRQGQASQKKSVKKKGFLANAPHLKELLLKVYAILITILFACTFATSSKATARVYEMEKVLYEKGAVIEDGKLLEMNSSQK